MPDRITKQQRSKIMSRIRSKNTSLEVSFKKLLSKNGFRGYRSHYRISGVPDIVFVSKRIAIFIDGDFWHGYNWKKLHKIPPKKYWQAKIERNIARDKTYTKQLKKEGWTVLRFWEHEIKRNPEKCLKRVKAAFYYKPKAPHILMPRKANPKEIKRLYRSGKDRILGGVCGGIAEYLNVDPVVIRLIWVAMVLLYGTGILLYIIAWIIIPRNPEHKWPKD